MMKKTSIILVGIIYIASIIIVSIFGLKAVMYDIVTPVIKVEVGVIGGQSNVQITERNDKKIIILEYEGPGNVDTLEGTVLQLEVRVYPDDANEKAVKYVYDRDSYPQIQMHSIDGRETGAIVFTGIAMVSMRVYSTDGTNIYEEILISVVDRIPD